MNTGKFVKGLFGILIAAIFLMALLSPIQEFVDDVAVDLESDAAVTLIELTPLFLVLAFIAMIAAWLLMQVKKFDL